MLELLHLHSFHGLKKRSSGKDRIYNFLVIKISNEFSIELMQVCYILINQTLLTLIMHFNVNLINHYLPASFKSASNLNLFAFPFKYSLLLSVKENDPNQHSIAEANTASAYQ